MKKLLLATTVAISSFSALSAESIDISVIGTISPAACTPIASGGGVVDYGFINPDQLAKGVDDKAAGTTVLDVKTIGFTVQCDAEANVAIRAKSNRGPASEAAAMNATGASKILDAATKAAMIKDLPYDIKAINPDVMGLGATSEGVPIGGYMMLLPTKLITLDGTPVNKRFYTGGQPTVTSKWSVETSGNEAVHGGSINSGTTFIGYAINAAATAPQAFTVLSGTLIVRAYITDQKNLNINSPINLDGSSTIELFYY